MTEYPQIIVTCRTGLSYQRSTAFRANITPNVSGLLLHIFNEIGITFITHWYQPELDYIVWSLDLLSVNPHNSYITLTCVWDELTMTQPMLTKSNRFAVKLCSWGRGHTPGLMKLIYLFVHRRRSSHWRRWLRFSFIVWASMEDARDALRKTHNLSIWSIIFK